MGTLTKHDDVLTDQEKLFCHEYLKTFDATASYLATIPDKSISKHTALSQGNRWIKRPAVRAYLAELAEKKLDKADAAIERVLDEIAAVAFFNPVLFADLTGDKPRLDLSKLMADPNAMRACLLEFGTAIDKDGGEHEVYKLKQQDKLAALFKLLDYHRIALLGDSINPAAQITVNVNFPLPGTNWKQPEQAVDSYIDAETG